MAEQVQRYRQYEYRANSNLVLTTDQHRPRTDEPSGEPESLKDHLDGTTFGDRVHYGKPDTAGGSQKRKAARSATSVKKGRKQDQEDNVLGLAEDLDSYRPRSKETRGAYEDLLSLIANNLGDQPHAFNRTGHRQPIHRQQTRRVVVVPLRVVRPHVEHAEYPVGRPHDRHDQTRPRARVALRNLGRFRG